MGLYLWFISMKIRMHRQRTTFKFLYPNKIIPIKIQIKLCICLGNTMYTLLFIVKLKGIMFVFLSRALTISFSLSLSLFLSFSLRIAPSKKKFLALSSLSLTYSANYYTKYKCNMTKLSLCQ